MLEVKCVPPWVSGLPSFVRADAPHLFRVGLEEDAEEARTELIPHPVFQVPRILYRLNPGLRVAGKAADGFDRAEVPERVAGFDGVGEEAAAVVDPRKTAPSKHLVAEDLKIGR